MADQPCQAGLKRLQSLNDIITGPHANPFALISIAVSLNDEAQMESDPVKVISDYSGSDAEDIDYRNQRNKFETLKSPCSLYI